MYKYKGKWYADAGKILRHRNDIGYMFSGSLEVTEHDLTTEDMKVNGRFVTYSNSLVRDLYNPNESYSTLKARLVHKLFSNDDQIAIILNKDDSEEDMLIYNKMQEWRAWCGVVAKKIKSLK